MAQNAALEEAGQGPLVQVLPPPASGNVIPPKLFTIGFMSGLLIAFACLVFAMLQLHNFQGDVHAMLSSPDTRPIKSDLDAFDHSLVAQHAIVLARIGLRSAAISLGVGFLFLGFSLFLLGVQGSSDLDAEANGYKLSMTRLAPGVVVILCAAVVTLVSAVQPLKFDIDYPGSSQVLRAGGTADTSPGNGDGNPDNQVSADDALKAANAGASQAAGNKQQPQNTGTGK